MSESPAALNSLACSHKTSCGIHHASICSHTCCFYPTFQSFIEVFLLQGSSSQSCLVGVYAHTSAKGDIRESWPHSWKVAESGLKCKFIPEESKLGPDSNQGALAQWPGRRKGYCGSALWVPTRDELNKKETSLRQEVESSNSHLVWYSVCFFFKKCQVSCFLG